MKKRRAILCILSGLMFLALITVLMARGQSHTEQFYSDALRAYDISTEVLVSGRAVTIRMGVPSVEGVPATGTLSREAARLAYARTLVERNPLFAFPGTSPSDLAYAADELQATANQLADLQQGDERAVLIRTSLYPIEFLRKAAEAEKARLEFLAHTDSQNEKAYELAVRRETAAYLSTLHTFRDAVAVAVPDTAPAYIAAGKIVSKAGILSALDTMEAGLRASITLFEARTLCLRGIISHCNPTDLSLPSLEIPERNRIDAESLTRTRELQSVFARATGDVRLRDAPLIVLAKSACTSDIPGHPIFSIADTQVVPGVPARAQPFFAGDIRFIAVRLYDDVTFYQDLHSRGIDFVSSPPLLHYECMDEASDTSAILSTRKILSTSSSSVFYEADAIRAAHARAASGDPAGIGEALAIQYSSAQFDQLARGISWTEQKNMHVWKQGLRAGLDIPNIFLSRSGFVSLFATHNTSFFPHNLDLFPPSHVPISEQPYRYDSQIPVGPQKTKLRQDVETYMILHHKGLVF